MFVKLVRTVAIALTLCQVTSTYAAVDAPSVTPAATEAKDTEYARKLGDRVSKIVTALELKDQAKANRVHALIVAQYKTLNVWHETYDSRLKELGKAAASSDAEKACSAKAEIESAKSALKTIHDNYLTRLAEELTPELVERVKDGMTVGKVQFTYAGYLQQIPSLTEEQKAKVLDLLKEAREEAIDAGAMDEKSAIFNRYKGRINNYLSKQGVNQGKGNKSKAEPKESAAK